MKKRFIPALILLSILFSLLLVPTTAYAADGNLLKNGSFEEGWKIGESSGWQWKWDEGNVDKTQGHSLNTNKANASAGNNSWYIDGTSGDWIGLYQEVTVKPGSYYKFDYKSKLSQGRVQIYVYITRPDGTELKRLMEGYGAQDGINFEHGIWYTGGLPLVKIDAGITKVQVSIKTAIADPTPVPTKGYIDEVWFYECDALGLPLNGGPPWLTPAPAPDPTPSTAPPAQSQNTPPPAQTASDDTSAVTSEESSTGPDDTANTESLDESSKSGTTSKTDSDDDKGGLNPLVIVVILAVVVILGLVGVIVLMNMKKIGAGKALEESAAEGTGNESEE